MSECEMSPVGVGGYKNLPLLKGDFKVFTDKSSPQICHGFCALIL